MAIKKQIDKKKFFQNGCFVISTEEVKEHREKRGYKFRI
jgi:hypothetical protein